jgi:hypothetical protein
MAPLSTLQDSELKAYLIAVAARPALSTAQRRALAQAWLAGEAQARRDLVESFMGVVVAEAALRRGLGTNFETLIAAGNRSLAGALQWVCADLQNLEARASRAIVAGLQAEWMKNAGASKNPR